MNDLYVVGAFGNAGVNKRLGFSGTRECGGWRAAHLGWMPTGDSRSGTRSPNRRHVGPIFLLHLSYLLQARTRAEHVKLSCNPEHQSLTGRIRGVVGKVHMSIDESWEKGAASPLDYVCIRNFKVWPADPADFSIFYQHTSMVEHMLTVKHPDIVYELRGKWRLTETRKTWKP
jgi:hypothetical protein